MAESISRSMLHGRGVRADRRDWSLIVGVVASVLALTYLASALHFRHVVNTVPLSATQSVWFPLQLFVIAVSPAFTGFIFLWSERYVQSRATQKFLRNIGIFGFGLLLAGWVAFLLK